MHIKLIKIICLKIYLKIFITIQTTTRKSASNLKACFTLIYECLFEQKFKIVHIFSIRDWCQQQKLPIKMLNEGQKIFIEKPKIFSIENHCENCNKQFQAGEAQLPPVFAVEIPNVKLIGGTEIINVKGNTILYDELALSDEGKYGLKTNQLYYPSKTQALLHYREKKQQVIEKAIHFCKDHSQNYFHWLIECLPRLSIINQFSEWDNLPLLIDPGLKPQQLEALNLLNDKNRKLITLKWGVAYNVNKLIYPSYLSVIHDNYFSPISYKDDILIAPIAINYLRESFMRSLKPKKAFRKLYIPRKITSPRALVNAEELESMFIDYGFEVIHPEHLSFENQLKIFSEAEIVVGATGAAMTNIIFMQPGTKVMVLYYSHPQANYYLFSQIANILKLDLQYVLGQEVAASYFRIHSSFIVSKEKVKLALDQLLSAESHKIAKQQTEYFL